jgi:hypothetical protein
VCDAGDVASSYLFIQAPLTNTEDLIALLRYAAEVRPQVGDNLEEALKAARVILIGEETASGQHVESVLRAASVPVERISEEIAQTLAARLSSSPLTDQLAKP